MERGPLSLVEFYTPSEYKLIEASGWKWPCERRLCLLCLRVATHRLFVQRRASNTASPPGVHYAKVSNLTGISGEYNLADCFVSAPDRFEGIVDPVVIPRLTDYDVCVVNGVRCVKQRHGMPSEFEDACISALIRLLHVLVVECLVLFYFLFLKFTVTSKDQW